MKSFTIIKNKFCVITIRKMLEDDGFKIKPEIIPHFAALSKHEFKESEKGKDVYTVVNYLIATHFEVFFLGLILTYEAIPIKQSTMLFKRL